LDELKSQLSSNPGEIHERDEVIQLIISLL